MSSMISRKLRSHEDHLLNNPEVNNETQYAQDDHILDCRGSCGYRHYPLCIEVPSNRRIPAGVGRLLVLAAGNLFSACKIQMEVQAGVGRLRMLLACAHFICESITISKSDRALARS